MSGGSIWYRVVGGGRGAPLVLLHGGPGFSSYYLKPYEDLGDERTVIRYDQLGGGKSDQITDTTMFTTAHFVSELDSLRRHFGYQRWNVFGHSWGTILAMEYYRAHPDRVASLIFGSPVFDFPAYAKRANDLLATLPPEDQKAVAAASRTGKFDGPEYQKAMERFYDLYLYRHPVKADLESLFASVNQGIYNYMQGPSEFTITGSLKNYDATSTLPNISVPTLVTVGEHDEVGPELAKTHADQIPGARYVVFTGAAHLTPWDARDESVMVVRDFLRMADSVNAAKAR